MPLHGSSDYLFENGVVDLTKLATAETAGSIREFEGNFKANDGIIDASRYPNSFNQLKIIASPASDTISGDTGSLTINLYDAEESDGETELTNKVASYGPFKVKDIDTQKSAFLEAPLPSITKRFIQIKVTGTAFTAGKVLIRVGF